ncbi:hypothetical protein BDF19DRAFT_416046 [Syncephalis fuscata]|nr:hypothetical protein BDF19DRAFT_416046 [Syncephalis fuscata]
MNSVATYAAIAVTAIIAHIGVLITVKNRRFGDETRDQESERSVIGINGILYIDIDIDINIEGRVGWASLAALAHADDLNVQKNAIRLLVEHAISDKENLIGIVRAARQSSNATLRLHACTVLDMLARQPDSQQPLLAAGALEAIVLVLKDNKSDSVMMHATLVLCVLIEQEPEACRQAMQLGAGEALIRILRDRKPLDDLLCGYTVNALQHLACIEEHHQWLIAAEAIEALASTLEFLFGKSITVLKLCMQALDVLIRSLDDQTAALVLPSLIEHHVADIIWCNLRVENAEMLCWTVHFLSQLACRKVGREQLQRIPDLVDLVGIWINPREPLLARDVLRTLILTRLIDCIHLSDERDLAFSALVVLQVVGRKEETQNIIMEKNAVKDFLALADSELLQNEQRIAQHQEALNSNNLSPEERAVIIEEIEEMQTELVRSDPFITDLLCTLSGGAVYGQSTEKCRQLSEIEGIWNHLRRYISSNQTYPRFRAICTLRQLSNVSPFITCQLFQSCCGPELMRLAYACDDHSTRHNAVIALLLQANQLGSKPVFPYYYEELITLITTQTIKPMIRKIISLIHVIYAQPIMGERARPALPMIFGLDVVQAQDTLPTIEQLSKIAELDTEDQNEIEKRRKKKEPTTANDHNNTISNDDDNNEVFSRPITPANTPVNERDLEATEYTDDLSGNPFKMIKIRELVTDFTNSIRLLMMFAIHSSFNDIITTLSLGSPEELPIDPASLLEWIDEMELLGAGGHRPFRVLLSLLLQMLWIPFVHSGQLSAEDRTFIRTKVSHTMLTGNLSGVDQLGDYIKRTLQLSVASPSSSISTLASTSSLPSSPIPATYEPMTIDGDEGPLEWKDACFAYSAQLLVCFMRSDSVSSFIDKDRFIHLLLDISKVRASVQPVIYAVLAQLVWQMKSIELIKYPELIDISRRLLISSSKLIGTTSSKDTTNKLDDKLSQSWTHQFYATLIMDRAINDTPRNSYTSLGLFTPNIYSVEGASMIYNPHWTFETFRSQYGVANEGQWAFEVIITVNGLVQVGWSTYEADYQPESGGGVGDDNASYSIDGHRCMKWHGTIPPIKNEYGERWHIGDVITCVVDFSACSLIFYLNGRCLGPAFTDIDPHKMLYPSISCSAHQGCRIRYGHSWDPLQYAPSDCQPIASTITSISSTISSTNTKLFKPSLLLRDLSPILYYEIRIGAYTLTDTYPIIIGCRDSSGYYEGLMLTEPTCHYQCGHSQSPVKQASILEQTTDSTVTPIEPVTPGEVIGCMVTLDQVIFHYQGFSWQQDHALTTKTATATNRAALAIYPLIANLSDYHVNYGQEPFVYYSY